MILADSAALFPILRELVFFNHAGVAPLSGPAADALFTYAEHASHRGYVDAGWYAKASKIKEAFARLLRAQSKDEIAFVPNTSTGLSLVAKGLTWQPGDRVVITNVEYPANRYPWEDLKRFGVELVEVAQRPDGRIQLDDVLGAITARTKVVAISHVQYASGHRISLRPIADRVHAAGGYLCVDAIQSLGVIEVNVQTMGIDFLAADGHKWLLGPEGAGIFYCRRELLTTLHPNIVGWMNMVDAGNYGDYRFEFESTARRFEPGSYNIPGILALGASLALLQEVGIADVWSSVHALTRHLCESLERKGYHVYSPREVMSECSAIVVFEPGEGKPPPQQIVSMLEKQGIIIVTREGRLRASPHFYNTHDQIDQLINALP